jgi:hypothetical protein
MKAAARRHGRSGSAAVSRRLINSHALRKAPHRHTHLFRQFANPPVAQLSETGPRLNQTLFPNHCNVLGAGGGIGVQPGFASRKKNVCRSVPVDAGRERHCKQSLRARMPVPGIQGDDDYRTPALLRRIDMELHKPDFASERRSGR